ncbi:hypothetical protein [Paenisporosarcina sp. NPDC076898]|uniref:hypothetical protein n=1 Tax=unclassified Paenisporosarcina TaxID=2642018 RepID=UPI003D070D2D
MKMKIRKNPEVQERFRKEFKEKCPEELVENLDKLINENIVLDEEDANKRG